MQQICYHVHRKCYAFDKTLFLKVRILLLSAIPTLFNSEMPFFV